MNELFGKLKAVVVEKKGLLIKVGSVLVGALIGGVISSALTSDSEMEMVEDDFESAE